MSNNTKTAEEILKNELGYDISPLERMCYIPSLLKAMEAYADQFRTEANTNTLRWVKASHRLPENDGWYITQDAEEGIVIRLFFLKQALSPWFYDGACYDTCEYPIVEWLEEVEATPQPNPDYDPWEDERVTTVINGVTMHDFDKYWELRTTEATPQPNPEPLAWESDLEKAADDYAVVAGATYDEYYKGFIAGAEWAKQYLNR